MELESWSSFFLEKERGVLLPLLSPVFYWGQLKSALFSYLSLKEHGAPSLQFPESTQEISYCLFYSSHPRGPSPRNTPRDCKNLQDMNYGLWQYLVFFQFCFGSLTSLWKKRNLFWARCRNRFSNCATSWSNMETNMADALPVSPTSLTRQGGWAGRASSLLYNFIQASWVVTAWTAFKVSHGKQFQKFSAYLFGSPCAFLRIITHYAQR